MVLFTCQWQCEVAGGAARLRCDWQLIGVQYVCALSAKATLRALPGCVSVGSVWSMYFALFVILGSYTFTRSPSVWPFVLCGNRNKLVPCLFSVTVRNKWTIFTFILLSATLCIRNIRRLRLLLGTSLSRYVAYTNFVLVRPAQSQEQRSSVFQ